MIKSIIADELIVAIVARHRAVMWRICNSKLHFSFIFHVPILRCFFIAFSDVKNLFFLLFLAHVLFEVKTSIQIMVTSESKKLKSLKVRNYSEKNIAS